ncbi:porin [Halorhodospira sp. 9622]|uniref:porin n=1 Tax=Halorhodospira sp. 9622 TaxID=2899136 RepID=UPI001EE78709|nr:porin [Halorhodospira sp. 9622]MCG5538413.1 porin [Halorhodospira sp. 9622]
MKKKLITLATATAMTAPAAVLADAHSDGPEVYGRVHLSLNAIDTDTGAEDSGIGISSNASRFGIRGSESLEGNISAIYQLELGLGWAGGSSSSIAGSDDGNQDFWDQVRDSYIGVEGDFGTVRAGRLPAANQYVYESNYLMDTVGDVGSITNLSIGGRFDTALQYETADGALGPFGAVATLAPSGSSSESDEADDHDFILRGTYAEGPLTVAATLVHIAADDDWGDDDEGFNVYTLGGSYAMDAFDVGVLYGVRDHEESDEEVDDQFIALGGALPVTYNGTVKAQLVHFMGDADDSDSTTFGAGYYHSLSDRTEVYGVAAFTGNDENTDNNTYGYGHGGLPQGVDDVGNDADTFATSVGLSHNF